MVKLSWFHTQSTCHNTLETLGNTAEQLSKCFSSQRRFLSAMPKRMLWAEKSVFSFPPPLDTLESSLQMDTCWAVSSWKHHGLHLGRPSEQAGGFTESSNSKGCWSQLLARWDKADNSLYTGPALPVPCHYLSISSFVFELLCLRVTVCCFLQLFAFIILRRKGKNSMNNFINKYTFWRLLP